MTTTLRPACGGARARVLQTTGTRNDTKRIDEMKTRRLTKGISQKDVARIIGEEQAGCEREKDKPRRYVPPGRPALAVAERAEVYSLRIPAARIGELKAVAAKKNKKPAALARDW